MPNAKRIFCQSVSHFRLSWGFFPSTSMREKSSCLEKYFGKRFPSRSVWECLALPLNITRVLFVMSSMELPSLPPPIQDLLLLRIMQTNPGKHECVCANYYTYVGDRGACFVKLELEFAEKRLKEEREGGESFPSLGDYTFNFLGGNWDWSKIPNIRYVRTS